MRRFRWLAALPCVVAIAVATLPARASAQRAAPPDGSTLLHLSATGLAQATPDELAAEMLAQAVAAEPAAAQRRVNVLIASGLAAAKSVAGVEAQAVGYTVIPGDPASAGGRTKVWTAMQTLALRSADGPALLGLVGTLQEKGFAAGSLDWRLSSELARKVRSEAIVSALNDLQTDAATAAAALGLRVDHLQNVRIGGGGEPRPLMRAMAAPAAAMPPPEATPTPATVTANVSAEVVLRP